MKIAELRKIILKSIDKYADSRDCINTSFLWVKIGNQNIKNKDAGKKLYRNYNAAVESLINKKLIVVTGKKDSGDADIKLTAEGREELEKINTNVLLNFWEEDLKPKIKSRIVELIFWLISIVFAYLVGYLKIKLPFV